MWDIDDDVPLRITTRNEAGTKVNAGTVTLTVTKPDGTALSPALSPTQESTGVYVATVPEVDQTGVWSFTWSIPDDVIPADKRSGQFEVGDPAAPTYLDLESFKKALTDLPTAIDAKQALMERALRAGARKIDRECHRHFYALPEATAREFAISGGTYFDPRTGEAILLVDDIATSTVTVEVAASFSTSWTTLAATAYELRPLGELSRGRPATEIAMRGAWPGSKARITTRWGYPRIPDEVVMANQILSTRFYGRRTTPDGIAGSPDIGGVLRLSRTDPDVYELIKDLIKPLS